MASNLFSRAFTLLSFFIIFTSFTSSNFLLAQENVASLRDYLDDNKQSETYLSVKKASEIIYQASGFVLYQDDYPEYDQVQADGGCLAGSGSSEERCVTFTIPQDVPYSFLGVGGWVQWQPPQGGANCEPINWTWSLSDSEGNLLSEPYFVTPGETYQYCLGATMASNECSILNLCLTPYVITIPFNLEHYQDFPNKPDPLLKAFTHTTDTENNNNVFSACADGSMASKYRITGLPAQNSYDWKLRVKENPNGDAVDDYGGFQLIDQTSEFIEFIYEHPKNFPSNENGKFTSLTLEVFDNFTNQAVKEFPLRVYRPPLVMVHGLWADGDTFEDLEKAIANNGYEKFLLFRTNYKSTNASSFGTNVNRISLSIETLLTRINEKKIASGKVDIVGHSMGGILSRLYLQSTNYKDDIFRLITLNTPHSGSQLANLLLDDFPLGNCLEDFFNDFGKSTSGGAIRDLQITSTAIKNTLNGSLLNRNIVFSHAIYSTANTQDFVDDQPGSLSRYGVSEFILGDGNFFRTGCELTQEQLNQAFDGESNDAIVAVSSQKGGLAGNTTSPFSGISHVGTPNNSTVINRIIQLLKLSPNNSAYTSNGFSPPTNLNYTRPNTGTLRDDLPSSKVLSSINISMPSEGQVFSPGDNINIIANGSTDITAISLLINYSIDSLYAAQTPNSTINLPFQVDNVTGKRRILAIGKNSSGEIVVDSVIFYVCKQTFELNQESIDNGTYAANTISSSGTIEDQDIVEFIAGNSITLLPGFQAEKGTTFSATIGDCGGSNNQINNNNQILSGADRNNYLTDNISIFPNPISDLGTIRYFLSDDQRISITLFDLSGRLVKTFIDNELSDSGDHLLQINTTDMNSGIYYVVLTTEKQTITKKLSVIR